MSLVAERSSIPRSPSNGQGITTSLKLGIIVHHHQGAVGRILPFTLDTPTDLSQQWARSEQEPGAHRVFASKQGRPVVQTFTKDTGGRHIGHRLSFGSGLVSGEKAAGVRYRAAKMKGWQESDLFAVAIVCVLVGSNSAGSDSKGAHS